MLAPASIVPGTSTSSAKKKICTTMGFLQNSTLNDTSVATPFDIYHFVRYG